MLKLLSSIAICSLLLSCNQNTVTSNSSETKDTSAIPSPSLDNIKINDTANGWTKETFKADITNVPVSISQFVLEGYTALDTVTGNLNLDAFTDMIMVLKKNGEDTTSDVTEHPEKRPLLILLGQPDKSLKQAARNDNAVYCIDCGGAMGDPFMGVVIKNGYFSVEHYGGSSWRWERIITFKYSDTEKNWNLHKDGHKSFQATEEGKEERKILTTKDFGKVKFEDFDIYK